MFGGEGNIIAKLQLVVAMDIININIDNGAQGTHLKWNTDVFFSIQRADIRENPTHTHIFTCAISTKSDEMKIDEFYAKCARDLLPLPVTKCRPKPTVIIMIPNVFWWCVRNVCFSTSCPIVLRAATPNGCGNFAENFSMQTMAFRSFGVVSFSFWKHYWIWFWGEHSQI